ncbi:MAG: hypothetical protein J2P54_23645 [Bradyrhizobiaceae bacterium]|nr:hypothetical protein [Bradyrhizobiaceae bacterium]
MSRIGGELAAAACNAARAIARKGLNRKKEQGRGRRVEGSMINAQKTQHHIDEALENRYARVTIVVGENIRNSLDLLDQQPAAVLEGIIERVKQMQRSGNAPKHRYRLREALIEYLEERLHEAREWESAFVKDLTGTHPPGQ